MNVTIADKNFLVDRLGKPYNPPTISSSFSESDFQKEWYHARDTLKNLLDKFGACSPYGDGDYFIDDLTDISRGIGVEITNASILNEPLVRSVQTLLNTFANAFEVHFLVIIKGLLFDVFVSRNEVEVQRLFGPERVI